MLEHAKLENRVVEALRESSFTFETEPVMGGLRPDFLVRGPKGRLVVVELKSWAPTQNNQIRAAQQAQFYRIATGADFAFVVMPGLKHDDPSRGLVSEHSLVEAIRNVLQEPVRRKERRPKISRARRKLIFAAMPFDEEYDDVFFVGIVEAAKSLNAEAKRVDKEEFSGDVVGQIEILIRRSAAVVADLSESKPNVLYEVGFAHAAGRPTVHICSTPLDKLPFDVRNWNTIKYVRGRTYRLKARLESRLRAIVKW